MISPRSRWILAALVLVVAGGRQMTAPIAGLQTSPLSLDPANLPDYALRTTLRMFAGVIASLIFTFVFATLAAKSRKAEIVIIPTLDILQSIPVLGFLTFTVTFFLGLFPSSQLGAELAVIFAIFTAQAWNMAFSFYQSLRSVPRDLEEVTLLLPHVRLAALLAARGALRDTRAWSGTRCFRCRAPGSSSSPPKRSRSATPRSSFPASAPISRSPSIRPTSEPCCTRSWQWLSSFFSTTNSLFRPIVAWADKFRVETTASQARPKSWVYDLARRTRLVQTVSEPIGAALGAPAMARLPRLVPHRPAKPQTRLGASGLGKALDLTWIAIVLAAAAWGFWTIYGYVSETLRLMMRLRHSGSPASPFCG